LFEKMGAHEITFDYLPTPRNGPVQSFFTEVRGEPPTPRFSLSKAAFDARVPALFHRVVEASNILPSAMASPYSAKLGGSL